jgi:hypothetical protein
MERVHTPACRFGAREGVVGCGREEVELLLGKRVELGRLVGVVGIAVMDGESVDGAAGTRPYWGLGAG